jgi:hypothetical protein
MAKTWKWRIGWHAYVRRPGDDDPNHQICLRYHQKRSAVSALFGIGGGGGGGSAMG